jgi:hypothetical protein
MAGLQHEIATERKFWIWGCFTQWPTRWRKKEEETRKRGGMKATKGKKKEKWNERWYSSSICPTHGGPQRSGDDRKLAIVSCKIWASHGCACEQPCLLGYTLCSPLEVSRRFGGNFTSIFGAEK